MHGVRQCGGGKWADIKKMGLSAIAQRSAVDLKDKWRNLVRVAVLPASPLRWPLDRPDGRPDGMHGAMLEQYNSPAVA